MEDNAEDSEISRNVKVSEYIQKINSATPQGTPETQRRFHVRNKVDDFSDCNITELPVFKEPICLLDTSEDGTLEIQQKAILQLNMLDKPFVVVGIAGLYRTGKSYLMNRLAGRNNGFALGSTIQSKTKGIWVWAREHPIYPEKFLLLLDTEGLGDAEKGNENHDNWIFSMTTLLSSTLIFNVLNAINEDSLEKLNFITVISKRIRFSSEESEEESDFDLISPLFIFALRDFSLDLEIDQQEVTSDEYMEHCLQLKEGESEDVKRYNRPRLCIRTYFKKRKCFTFDRPVSKKKMKYLDLFIDSGLSKEFKEEVDTFVEYVHKEALEKKLHTGQPVSGPVFCTLVATYLDAINNGVIPNTESAIKALSLVENQKTVEKSLELYKRLMHDRLELPVPTEDLLCRIHLQCHQEAVSFFMERALMDEGDAKLAELNKLIGISFEEMKEKNKEASMEKCWATLKQLEASLQHKLQNGIYATEGGYITYQQDFQTILDQYNERKDLGNQKNECQLEYRQMKIAESAIVLATDKFVSEKERIAREEQERALQAEREKQAAERERQTVVRMTQEKDLMLQQTKREIETRNANQLKELNQHHQSVLQQKLREQERLLREGHDQQASALRNEINRLKRR